jgi:hypothetical protein
MDMHPPLIPRKPEKIRAACYKFFLVTLLFTLVIATATSKSFAAREENASTASPLNAHPGKSTHPTYPTNFGFQCGNGDTQDCGGQGYGSIIWPTTQSQPGMLRLHDAGTHWSTIDEGSGAYNWVFLDQWLDLIAQHQPVKVSQVFTWVPCYLVAAHQCSAPPTAPSGTNVPPRDLTANGSPSFNNFVTLFVQHCSPNGNCVKNLIRGYEMWNEWDIKYHWTGSMEQIYQMVKPAVAIIRANVPNAVILMPSTTPDSDTGLGYQADFQNWLNYENANGRISDWIDWHVYLTNTNYTTRSPEDQWNKFNVNFLSIQASTPGWETTPWANTETNFNGAPPPGLNYTCPAAQFTKADCTGQIVRWQLLHASNGGRNLAWYKWKETIGSNQQYDAAYNYMMQYLGSGKFTAPCSSTMNGSIPVWTCGFVQSNGTNSIWVWTPTESGTTYTVPSGFTNYRDLNGGKTSVVAGHSIAIGPEPIMLE